MRLRMKRLILGSILGLTILGVSAHADAYAKPRVEPFVELAMGPVIGIDGPLKGGAIASHVGLALYPFELRLRANAAYYFPLKMGILGVDIVFSIGPSMRAIVGGLLPFGPLSLQDPSGSARIPVIPAPWPDRFGLGATIVEFPWKPLEARVGIEAELLYTAYNLQSATALVGAAAFAASVEATVSLRVRWGAGAPYR